PDDHTVVTASAWKAIESELPERRAAYAAACARAVHQTTTALVASWQDGFLDDFTHAGENSESFASTQQALTALTGALFYVSTFTTHFKLGRPVFCTSGDCVKRTEHSLSLLSKDAIAENLTALTDVLQGLPPASGGDEMYGLYDLAESNGANWFPSTLELL